MSLSWKPTLGTGYGTPKGGGSDAVRGRIGGTQLNKKQRILQSEREKKILDTALEEGKKELRSLKVVVSLSPFTLRRGNIKPK